MRKSSDEGEGECCVQNILCINRKYPDTETFFLPSPFPFFKTGEGPGVRARWADSKIKARADLINVDILYNRIIIFLIELKCSSIHQFLAVIIQSRNLSFKKLRILLV